MIALFWTSGDICPGFQSQGRSLVCMLPHLHATNSSDSPLVQHLLTSWRPAWQSVIFPTYMYARIRSGDLLHSKQICYPLGHHDWLHSVLILHVDIAVILWSGCFVFWIEILTRNGINPAWTDCKLAYFLIYFGGQYSSMLLVLISVAKCFAVYFPLKSKAVCTVRTAKWATGIVGIILIAYNLQWFIRVEWSNHYTCVSTKYFHDSLDFIDAFLYSFGPSVVMFVTNFAIAFRFIRAKCERNHSSPTESINQALSKSATRGTAMVVTVSVTFLILTAPYSLHFALDGWYSLADTFPLYRAFMNFTLYLNHSINCILYCIVGSRFRDELIKIFCCNIHGK